MTGNPELRNPCNEVVSWTTSPCLQSFIVPTFFRIDTMLSINTNVPYMMCYAMRLYIATLPAICRGGRQNHELQQYNKLASHSH